MEINAVRPDVISRLHVEGISANEEIIIVPIGDIHYENAGCDLKALRETIAFVKETPRCFAIVMGDVIDGIAINDKRYFDGVARDYKDESIWQDICYEIAREFFPIREKIAGIHGGNHEKAVAKRCQFDATQAIVDRLNDHLVPKELKPSEARVHLERLSDGRVDGGIRNLRYCAITRFSAQRRGQSKDHGRAFLDVWSHHGAGGGGTNGAKINKLEKAMDIMDAGLFLMGHVHSQVASTRTMLRLNRNSELEEVKKKFIVAASYLRSYEVGRRDDYSEQGMANPATIGLSYARWRPFVGAHIVNRLTIVQE